MIKTPCNKAAGSAATEAYPWGTSQGDVRLITQLDGVFIILLEGERPLHHHHGLPPDRHGLNDFLIGIHLNQNA